MLTNKTNYTLNLKQHGVTAMDGKKTIAKETVFYVIVPIICVIITIIGSYIVQDRREESLVRSLVGRFDQIEENMDLEQALDLAFEEKQHLSKKIDAMIDADVYSPGLVIDGLKTENSIGKGIVDIDGNIYFSSDVCARIWGEKPMYDKSGNTVYYSKDTKTFAETKLDLISEEVIYDGKYLTIYKPSDGKTFSMGSDTFNKGFTIGSDNYSLFGEGNGYALFDLKGKYSKLNISVARVNRSDLGIEDATLKVYLNGEYDKEYVLSGQKPPTDISIDLNYADNLKLEVCGSKIVYGFAEGTLEK